MGSEIKSCYIFFTGNNDFLTDRLLNGVLDTHINDKDPNMANRAVTAVRVGDDEQAVSLPANELSAVCLSAACNNTVTKRSVHPAASCFANVPQSTHMSVIVEKRDKSSCECSCESLWNHRAGNTLTCCSLHFSS